MVYAKPGTVIEIRDKIVKKDMSFIDPHRKFIEIELFNCNNKIDLSYVRPLRARLAGITANPSMNPRASLILPHIPTIRMLIEVFVTQI